MFRTKRLMVAGLAAVLMAGLGACGGGDSGSGAVTHGGGSGQAQPSPETVSGLRDTVRHLDRKTVMDTRAHLVRKCTTATERVRHTSSSGSGTHRKTRAWYTTEHHRSCKKVRQGTERYRRVVRAERWCVSLDDVNGAKARDGVWYQVSRAAYDQARAADEHSRIEFTPRGSGC
ncbi:hypothetical protein ABZT17_04135 [Streptomyces sp. NPDC005648]|uniref:hypothetical protein n=1 Tax=Streptomyces sp. NPDC005648 TaxID=3157044 RepID=UPI0033AD6459